MVCLLTLSANNNSTQTKDQDLLSHLIRSLSSLAGMVTERSLTGLSPGSQDFQNAGTSDVTPVKVLNLIEKFYKCLLHFCFNIRLF